MGDGVDNKTDQLPHHKQVLYRATRAQRRQIVSMKRQHPVSGKHPILATDQIA